MRRTGGAAVVDALRSVGIDVAFGIPGTHNLEIYRYLPESGITHVAPRHEQGGGYAADGYARVTGRPAVCLPTSGPGVTNILTAVATAYADSVPMLVVAPGPPRGTEGRDLGLLHELRDQRGAVASIVEVADRPETPADAGRAVQAAFVRSTTGRVRPQYVEVPVDVLEEDWDGTLTAGPPALGPTPRPDPSAVQRAGELLSRATRPVILAGGGCRGASGAVEGLAERLACPVLTTVNGKGVLSESHQLSLGASLRIPSAIRLLEHADVLLLVGTELGDSDLWGHVVTPRGAVIRVDVDPNQLQKNVPAETAVCGDAAEVLQALAPVLEESTSARWDIEEIGRIRTEIAEELDGDGSVWREIQNSVRAAVGGDVVVAGDSAMVSYFGTVHHWPMGPGDRFLYPTGYATLGYGLPAAIGALVGQPDVPTVVLVGDGGFTFTVQELMAAVERRLALPVVVVSNGGYGAIRDQMRERSIRPLGVDLTTPDLGVLARAFGARGCAVADPDELTDGVAKALTADVPTLVEVRV